MSYKDKEKQREASKEAMRRYRAKQGITGEGITNNPLSVTGSDLPPVPLPDDPIIACNAVIGWADVLAMPQDRIDITYHTSRVLPGDDVLLRLRRAAGYYRRVG